VYGGVAEVSIYVGNNFRGQGVGRLLLTELIRQSEENGLWMLQAGIFPENRPALLCIQPMVSGRLATAKKLANTTASGATFFCWNAGAKRLGCSRIIYFFW